MVKRFLLVLTVAIYLLLITPFAWATTVTLGWTPNSESNLVGYHVYQDNIKVVTIECPANTPACCAWNSEPLSTGEHNWYATAYNADQESSPSNTVSYMVELGAPSISITINLNQ